MFSVMLSVCTSIARANAISTNLNKLSNKRSFHESCVTFAARKGTREKARKKKGVKVEEKKVGFIPHNIRAKNK